MPLINGTAGNDSLTGTASSDSISGFDGNDTLNGLGAVDSLIGGAGNDTYIVTAGDVLSDAGGIDTVLADVSWSLGTAFENLTLIGSANLSASGNGGDNLLVGNTGNNFFNPRSGNDTVQGGAGNDTIGMSHFGTPSYGDDVFDGGAGFDQINYATASSPPRSAMVVDLAAGTITGGGDGGASSAQVSNFEHVITGEFNDRLTGDAAANMLEGRGGNDTFSGGGGNDTLVGGAGADDFVFLDAPASGGVDRIADFVSGTDDLVFENAAFTALGAASTFTVGDPRFAAGAGFTSGRDVTDRLVYDTSTGNLYYDADGNGSGGSQLIATFTGNPALVATDITVVGDGGGGGGTPGNDSLVGTEGNDTLDGGDGNDTLRGLGGNDSLIGGNGSDLLDGGAGVDTMDGGAGNDTYIVARLFNPPDDMLIDSGGIDTIIVEDGTSAVLPDGFENVTIRGTEADPIEALVNGNSADNIIRNESQAHFVSLDGEGGNDTLLGGDHSEHFRFTGPNGAYGNDVVDGGGGQDALLLTSGGSVVVDFRAGTASGGGTGSVVFSNIEAVSGGTSDDLLVANDAGVAMLGDAGDDTLTGGAGNDTLQDDYDASDAPQGVKVGNDQISGGAGDDRLVISRGNDTVQAGTGNDYIFVDGSLASFDTDRIDGGDGVDTLELDVLFSEEPISFVVDLAAGTLTAGDAGEAGSATLTAIENFIGFAPGADIRGTAGANALVGGGKVNGRAGADILTGGGGADQFVFDQAPGPANADLITNFQPTADTLELHAAAMPELGVSGRFIAGDARFSAGAGFNSGRDASDRVVYDTSTGNVYYDGDGSGGGAAQLIATLEGRPALAATDIVVVGGGGSPGATIRGTEGDDTLDGTAGNDTIDGLGGNDILSGGFGTDLVRGGTGNDRLKDREDSDPAAPDTLDGGLGDDIFDLLANSLRPHMTVIVDAGGVDTVWSNHDFVLPAGIENLTLFDGRSGIGNELGNMMVTFGNVLDYSIDGAGGNDTLVGAPNSTDVMRGGPGNDAFRFLAPSTNPSANRQDNLSDFASGTDTLELANTGFANLGAAGRFSATDERFYAAPGAATEGAQDASDRLIYDTGPETGFGMLFYDSDGTGPALMQHIATLNGPHTLLASDIVVIGDAGSGAVIDGTGGNDSLSGTEGNDSMSGLAGGDTINALGGNDTLDGGAGIDTLNGGPGDDTYIVTVGDVVSDTGGIDTVFADVSWALGTAFENLTLAGGGNLSATGNGADNLLVGNSGNNFFNPRSGNDTVQGGAGNDTIGMSHFGTPSYGDDVFDGGAGFDQINYATASSPPRSAMVVDLAAGTITGGGDGGASSAQVSNVEYVITGEFNDRLTGDAAANMLEGRGGNDTLTGAGGNDTLSGGAGSDHFVFVAPVGVDRITDFASGADELLFENAAFSGLGSAGAFGSGDGRFAAGAGFTSGRDSGDRLVYDTSTGSLYYDADGSGSGGAQLVATFQGNPGLTASDFTVI